jgi:hypothetical protein
LHRTSQTRKLAAMSNRPIAPPQKTDTKTLAREQRRARLTTELRSNLLKRKQQARARAVLEAPASEREKDQSDARAAATADKRGPTGGVARRAP